MDGVDYYSNGVFFSETTTASSGANADGSSINTSLINEQLATLSINAGKIPTVQPQKLEKDPRKIARKYQMDLCKKALEENVVVYLETGCGKTHIANLLIYEMGHLIKKPQKNICIFLAPTVALVQQQAKVIEESVDFKVGTYCGSSKRLKTHHEWEKEMEEYEVFVMTPQIMLHNLSHCLMKMELIALLIFDECHYAQLESNHPYAEIMKVFYKSDVFKLPRIFGMTASPILGKGGSIDGLESLLRSRIYSVEDRDELEKFVASPKVNVHYYNPTVNGSSCAYLTYFKKLEDLKKQCMLALPRTEDHNTLRSTKKMLQKLHDNLIFCVENLGIWGALQACVILIKGDRCERNELTDVNGADNSQKEVNGADSSLCDRYLTQAASVLTSIFTKDGIELDISKVEVLKEPFFSRKLLCLIKILRNFRLQPNMKCIIFVNRIVTARSLSYILRNLKFLFAWKCDFLLGVHSGLKSMSRKNTNIILEKFRSGEVNLLVATKVGEEGLDIQTCCLVIRFDLPETVASFIQSRGRARMPQSEYTFLVNNGNEKELNLIKHFIKEEGQMNKEILSRKAQVTVTDFDEEAYKVDLTGATISASSSVSLLHHYCSKLPHDEYFNPKPQFFFFEDADGMGMVCQIILPCNAPIHQIVSAPRASTEAAKRDACLKACKSLHEIGGLTDYLLPEQDDANDEDDDLSDSGSCDDEDSRRELHEMLIPTSLKERWTELDDPVSLNSYYFKFCPNPVDRLYRKFGLFVKAPLPKEAKQLRLELHLNRGRSVLTELIPSGVSYFEKDELVQAEKYQKMFLKVILDRSEFIPEFVSLENSVSSDLCPPTFYLLLPVIVDEDNKVSVDWNLISRCLSSPIFGAPRNAANDGISQRQLHLANGVRSFEDVINSMVYVPCKDTFFFISDVVTEKNGYDTMKESKDSKTHVDHYNKSIFLAYPNQPLLKAKQLFCLDNLLRKTGYSELREKVEHFIELPPEICQLKIIGFSKDIGSSLSLLPSIMHRLESVLVAVELRDRLSASFPEGAEVTVEHVLEALTTEKCNEHFSLERLEVLGDAFLKFAVGRHLFLLHDSLDEGQLTRKRSNIVNNSNLLNLATRKNLQVYIRDQTFEPGQFFALGRPCPLICTEDTEKDIHSSSKNDGENSEVKCNKCHHWLHKKTIADVFEALVGAFIVDSGFKAAAAFLKWMGIQIDFEDSQVRTICSASTSFLPLASQLDTNALENLLGYHFVHKGLLIQAFLHPSCNSNLGGCYQRLEFLGDAVMDYLITSYLYSVYPMLKPGQMTDLRSALVNNNSFADVAIRYSFHKFIISDSSALSRSMDKYASFIRTSATDNGCIQEPSCPKALGDLVESCIGAILLDSGFDLNYAWKIMMSLLYPVMNFTKLRVNPIRDITELSQSHNLDLQFSSLKKDGVFTVIAKVKLEKMSANATATNHSKKAAKRLAANHLLSALKERGYKSKSKSLADVLKESKKMKAQLIGYDETPSIVSPELPQTELQELKTDYDFKIRPLNEIPQRNSHTNYGVVPQPDSSFGGLHHPRELQPLKTIKNVVLTSNSQESGGLNSKSAKAHLYEICTANYWKPPTFECYQESGPSHLREFTFRVVVQIEEALPKILECYGEPRAKKKDAAEHAAEGALWHLKHEGYLGGES